MYMINILEELGGVCPFFTVHYVIKGRIYWYKKQLGKKFFIWEEMDNSQVTGRNCIVLYNGACSVQGRLCHYTHLCVTGMMSTVELPPHGRQMSHYTSPHVTGTHMEGNSWLGSTWREEAAHIWPFTGVCHYTTYRIHITHTVALH